VKVNVYIPKNISKDEKKTLEKLQESSNFSPKPDEDKNFFSRVKDFFE
jgi:molecular chaperone DnaJ